MYGASARPPETGRKLFVGGVPAGVDQHIVKDDFMQYGDIEDVYLPTDHDTGKLRGIAFVTFVNSEDAHKAAGAMHGRDYHGRQITVTMATPKNKPEGGKGGSFHGKGGTSYSYSRPRDYYSGHEDRRRYEEQMQQDRERDKRGDRPDGPGRDRERDDDDYYDSRGPGYGGTERFGGQYGARDPRPTQDFYD